MEAGKLEQLPERVQITEVPERRRSRKYNAERLMVTATGKHLNVFL